ncbi:RICIN domain-containing protein [Streptomyces lydicus]|uniref:RICIN domain-containing protein n=1 Tax=Streptomyces lydicus TaxID=47763 RepID=UPI0010133DFA|nr:helix-turn-helix domain-containing protein [Streptomyces lydicus]UEG91983.1 helix-turn-helix domain-containing protein [Streptomyces lydicus]
MTRTGGTGGSTSRPAGGADALVARMQQLKDQSGLTYRQLEQRAAENGEVLARSTLADVLRRRALPREELLGAFLRAHGCPPDEVAEWLAVRRRIEAGVAAGPGRGRPSRKQVLTAGAAALVALLLAGGALLLARGGGGDATGGGGARPGAANAVPLPTGEVLIRPLRTPTLCLTDGRVLRAHAYRTVAVRRPCAQAVPPHTHLTAAGAGRHRIRWTHPDHGTGCLVLLRDKGVAGLLEPWEDCTAGGPAQLFRVEPVTGRPGRAGAERTVYRLRLSGPDGADDGRCVTLGGDGPDATALVRPCSGADDQKFLIGPA